MANVKIISYLLLYTYFLNKTWKNIFIFSAFVKVLLRTFLYKQNRIFLCPYELPLNPQSNYYKRKILRSFLTLVLNHITANRTILSGSLVSVVAVRS